MVLLAWLWAQKQNKTTTKMDSWVSSLKNDSHVLDAHLTISVFWLLTWFLLHFYVLWANDDDNRIGAISDHIRPLQMSNTLFLPYFVFNYFMPSSKQSHFISHFAPLFGIHLSFYFGTNKWQRKCFIRNVIKTLINTCVRMWASIRCK